MFGATNLTMAAAASLRRSDGSAIPIVASTKFFYGHSMALDWGGFVECDTTRHLLALMRQTPTLERVVWWDYPEGYADMPTPEDVQAWFERCEPR